MSAPIPSPLDGNQVLQHAFEDATGRLRVDAVVTASVGSVTVIDGDGDELEVNSDGSINTNIQVDAADGDNVAISDGTNTLDINTDGSIKTIQIFTLPFDAISATYPSTTQEVYQSRVGGISGAIQQTVTINYTDSSKNYILNVART